MKLRSTIALACLLILGGARAASAATYYVAANGNDGNSGSQSSPWKTFAKAQSVAVGGDTVYFRGGTYNITRGANSCTSQTSTVNAILLNKSGSSGKLIRYWAYQSEKPVFNFSQMTDDCRIKGINVTANYIHLRGLEITGVEQHNNLNHESWGIWINGDNNVFERLDIHHNMGPGLFISSGGGNLVLNSDSHHNYDELTSNGAGESADGFGGHPEAGQAVNTFRGCRAWMNSDDGFDLISAYSPVVIENSWAWQNGYIPGTTTPIGNGNGFKMGGYGGDYDPGGVKHTLRFSLAFNNKAAGVYANHHTVANDYYNNTSYNNHPNFNMLSVNSSNVDVAMGKLRNNIAYGGTLYSNMSSDTAYNSWTLPVGVSNNDFNNMLTTGWDAPRQADGSLPVLTSLHLKTGSDLIDKGTNLGFSYNGSAPDLGAFEK
jgi:hypothetical protein